MGTGQRQGGQMGGMGQPGGVPGGGIAGLAPQVGRQMGGFGQMMNQAVAPQPTMLGFSQFGRPPGDAASPPQQPLSPQMPGYMQQQAHQKAQQGMVQPGMGQPGMGQRSIGDMSFFQPPQQGGFAPPVGGQPGMGQMPPGMAQRQQPTAANASAMNQFNLMQSQAQGRFGAPGAPGMGPPGMQRPQGGMGVARPQGIASMMGGFRR